MIVGLGTNDILDGGMALAPRLRFPGHPRHRPQRRQPRLCPWVLERPEEELDTLLGKADEEESRAGTCFSSEGIPSASRGRSAT